MTHKIVGNFGSRFGVALLLCAITIFSFIATVRGESTEDLNFHYKMGAGGGGIADTATEQYTYDTFGFQIIRTRYYDPFCGRDSETWDWDEFEMWCPLGIATGQCDLLVYEDPPNGPPFWSSDYNTYMPFPDNSYYYGRMLPDSTFADKWGNSINFQGGHQYYITTQGFHTLYPHQPLYPPPLWINTCFSSSRCKEGDSSITLFPSPKLIDTMGLPAGMVTYYNLTINCSAGNYFDEDSDPNQVKIEFRYGAYDYSFWLVLDETEWAVKLYAGCYMYPIPVGGVIVPVDKFGLLAPYIGLASTILVATTTTTIYVKRVKRRKEKR